MKLRMIGSTVLSLMLSLNTARASEGPAVQPFEADGVVADVHDLFPIATKDGKKTDRGRSSTTLRDVAARALVTEDGVYASLESPENQRALRGVKSGASVHIKGRLLAIGALLHIDPLAAFKAKSKVDITRYAKEKGEEVTLGRSNKCECGLSVADIPHP